MSCPGRSHSITVSLGPCDSRECPDRLDAPRRLSSPILLPQEGSRHHTANCNSISGCRSAPVEPGGTTVGHCRNCCLLDVLPLPSYLMPLRKASSRNHIEGFLSTRWRRSVEFDQCDTRVFQGCLREPQQLSFRRLQPRARSQSHIGSSHPTVRNCRVRFDLSDTKEIRHRPDGLLQRLCPSWPLQAKNRCHIERFHPIVGCH